MKIDHLKKAAEFKEILTKGNIWKGEIFQIFTQQRSTEEKVLLGVVLAKRFAPTAVQRNYIRRRIYAFFYERKDVLVPGTRNVVRLTQDIRGKSGACLKNEISREMEKAMGFLRKNDGK